MPSKLDILIQHYFGNVGKVHPQSHCYHHIYVARYNANKLSPIGAGFIFAHHHYKISEHVFQLFAALHSLQTMSVGKEQHCPDHDESVHFFIILKYILLRFTKTCWFPGHKNV